MIEHEQCSISGAVSGVHYARQDIDFMYLDIEFTRRQLHQSSAVDLVLALRLQPLLAMVNLQQECNSKTYSLQR